MERLEAIHLLINHTRAKNYLEIGVANGSNFQEVHASYKQAVDPAMKINWRYKFHSIRQDFKNINNKYFHLTSDAYFESQKKNLEQNKIDVSFVDGLHTYAQTLIDVVNVLRFLNPNGAIVMHDCSPPDKACAWPANSREHADTLSIPGFTGQWSGDSWKAIHHLIEWNRKWNALDIFVLDCDFGLGIVIPKKNFSITMLSDLKPELKYENLTYEFLDADRKQVIHLENEKYLQQYLKNKNR